jgi:DNA polymerase-3 subunit beta
MQMKFTVNKGDILNLLAKVQGLTGRKTNLAITSSVLIRSTESGIVVVATDLETGFEGHYPAEIETEGIITVNARKLFEIIRDFPSQEIHIHEVENRWIEIRNQNVEYHIVGLNPDDFPDSPHVEAVTLFEIDSGAFKRMIEKTVSISSTSDDQRAHLVGLYLEGLATDTQKILRLVSTDGRRLSKADYFYEPDFDLPLAESVLIPKKGMNEVIKFLETEGTVRLGLINNHFVAKKDTETITIRLLEGDFPKYKDLLVKEDKETILVEKQMFMMMLKRMSILTSENYKGAVFHFGDKQLVIRVANPEIGEAKESMPIDYEGKSLEIAFNPKYFIDTLNVIESERVLLSIKDQKKPCLVQGEENKSFLSVIMPMKL